MDFQHQRVRFLAEQQHLIQQLFLGYYLDATPGPSVQT